MKRRVVEVPDVDLVPVLNVVSIIIPFLLMGASFLRVAALPGTIPADAPIEATGDDPAIRVDVDPDGFVLFAASDALPGGRQALPCRAGCTRPEDWEVAGLRAALARLHDAHPSVTTIVVSPAPELDFERVIQAMDAVRSRPLADGSLGPLFPDVVLGGRTP